MWGTNLRILGVVLGTIALYTLLANAIPQVESEVPEELSFTGDVSPEQLIEAGQELYDGAGGCTACHGLGTRAPNLLTDQGGLGAIGARCGQRVAGEDCKAYLHQSMVDPNAYVVEGFQPIMPDMSRTLSEAQIWSMIAFLQSQGGEVTVTAADLQTAAESGADGLLLLPPYLVEMPEAGLIAYTREVSDVTDLNQLAPSLQVKTDDNAANPKIFIRGVGLNDFNPNTAPLAASL